MTHHVLLTFLRCLTGVCPGKSSDAEANVSRLERYGGYKVDGQTYLTQWREHYVKRIYNTDATL